MDIKHISEVIKNWDPIDLFPAAPNDEYSEEVEKIFAVVNNKNISDKELAEQIENIFIEAFGVEIFKNSKQDCLMIARKIKA